MKIIARTGDATWRSDPFEITKARTRLWYKVEGGDYAGFYLYIVREGRSLMKDGGVPEVMRTGPGEDTLRLVKSPGMYYLEIQTAGANWAVSVEELR